MKTVFTGREIFHVFAAQKQWEGKTGNRNVSFRDTVLFSYAQPIARIVPETSHGSKVALITSRKFSITTSGHTRAASSALSHFRVFYVPLIHLGEKQGANINYLWDMYSKAVAENMKARNLPWWIEETPEGLKPKRDYNPLCDLARDVEDFAECFGLGAYDGFGGSGAEMTWKEDTRRIIAHHAARIARQNTPQAIAKREKDKVKRAAQNAKKNRQEAERRARIEKEREERNAKEDATRAERIEAWRKGGAALFSRDLNTLPHALLRVKGDTLETSHGARVPLEDAKRVFAFITRGLAIAPNMPGEKSYRAKLAIGQYSLDEIFANGDFRAGCHSIKYEEAARLAAEIGFTPLQETPEGWRVIEA
jgi:hypothetical protein